MSAGGGRDGPACPLWIISFADMISNLVIFFIVVATFATKNTEGNSMAKKVLDRQVGIFGDVRDRQLEAVSPRAGTIAQHGEAGPESRSQRKGADASALSTRIQDAGYRVRPRVTKLDGGVRISLEEAGAFLAGSDGISAEGREVIAEIGRFYREENVAFVVEGHTDDRSYRFSRHENALELSKAMAISAAVVLAHDAGVAGPRVGIAPRGASSPLEPNATATGRARNRRIEIVVREAP